MDNVIFELRFLRKMILCPTINNEVVDLYSAHMDTDLYGMDINAVRSKRDDLTEFGMERTKADLIRTCIGDVEDSLFPQGQRENAYQNITGEQMTILLEMLTFLLVQFKSCEGVIRHSCQTLYIWSLIQLMAVLLASNKQPQCEVWIREHLSELTSLRIEGAAASHSILHQALMTNTGGFPVAPFARLLIEVGKMDVNVENTRKETPFHKLCAKAHFLLPLRSGPTEDEMRIVELLIDNGAHMDSMDDDGLEASWFFSQRFPQFSFNVNLKCLAARAILQHGIRYEKRVPADLVTFIGLHKPRCPYSHLSKTVQIRNKAKLSDGEKDCE